MISSPRLCSAGMTYLEMGTSDLDGVNRGGTNPSSKVSALDFIPNHTKRMHSTSSTVQLSLVLFIGVHASYVRAVYCSDK